MQEKRNDMEKVSVRIVAAVPHNETEELEVILEVTKKLAIYSHGNETELRSVWIDAHKLLEMGG